MEKLNRKGIETPLLRVDAYHVHGAAENSFLGRSGNCPAPC